MSPASTALELTDFEPETDHFAEDVIEGLSQARKHIHPKYFYDATGSKLFEEICATPEYYPTRTELGIMQTYAGEIAAMVGPGARLVEFGSGSSLKTHELIRSLKDPVAYLPVDISREHLMEVARDLNAAYPTLEVLPICADFTKSFSLPAASRRSQRTLVYFPGSTIGNFYPHEATALMRHMARLAGLHGAVLIGVDLQKDVSVLEAAYNDKAGVTRAFNLNLLERINRELGGDFDLTGFEHYAFYNEKMHRIEMHLVSLGEQSVTVAGREFRFRPGETIHTECSHKYTDTQFAELAAEGGLSVRRVWKDPKRLFSVQYLETIDE